jgi:cytochrome c-type biogenesis protein
LLCSAPGSRRFSPVHRALLPAYLGIIVGESADAHDPARAVPATFVFVLGFAAVFASLGAAAGLLGSSLHDFQNGVERVGGVVVAIMGLALLGVLRGPFARERRRVPRLPGGSMGSFRPFVVGVAFGAAWSPCVGPLLAAALTVAARSGQAGRGALLLLSYAFGIGVPFLLAALGLASSPAIAERLRRAGPTIEHVARCAAPRARRSARDRHVFAPHLVSRGSLRRSAGSDLTTRRRRYPCGAPAGWIRSPRGRVGGEDRCEDDCDRDDDEHGSQRERWYVRNREAVGEPSPDEAPAGDTERDPDHQADDREQRGLPGDGKSALTAGEADGPEDGEVVPAAAPS